MPETSAKPEKSSTTYTYYDPSRTFDGTPYESAAKSLVQVDGICRLLQRSLIDTNTQARNAFMQRNLDQGLEAQAEAWPDQPEARILDKALKNVGELRKKLPHLMRAVAFDPNAKVEDDE